MTQSWRVSIGFADVEVEAGGWLDALALGLPDLGIDFGALGSLAVEPLEDGGVVAHDPLTELEIRVVPIGATPVFVMPVPSFDAVDVPEPAGLVPARTAGDPFPIVATGPERPVAPPPPAAWPGRAPDAPRAALPPSRRPPAAYTPEPMAAPPAPPPAAVVPEDPDDAPDPWIAAVEEESAPDLAALADTPEPMGLRGAPSTERRNPGVVPPPIGVAPWDLPADPTPVAPRVVAPATSEAAPPAVSPPAPPVIARAAAPEATPSAVSPPAPPVIAPAPPPVEAARGVAPPPIPPPPAPPAAPSPVAEAARPAAPPPVPAPPPVEAAGLASPPPPAVAAPPLIPPPPVMEPPRRAAPAAEASPPPVAPRPPAPAPAAEAFVEADTTVGGQVVAARAVLSQDEVEDLFLQLGEISNANGVAAASGIALRILLGLVPAGAGAVLIRTRAGDGLRFRAASGPAASQLVDSVIPLDRGIAGFVAQLGVGLSVADARRDRRHDGRVDRSTGFTTRALLAVPVKDRGAPFGCIELLNPPRPFDERDLELATRVAASLGSFLQSVYAAH